MNSNGALSEVLYFTEQIAGRTLSKQEIDKTIVLLNDYEPEQIMDAYEKTILNTKKLLLPYACEILKSNEKNSIKQTEQIYSLMCRLFKNPSAGIIKVWVEDWKMTLTDIVLAYGKMMKNCEKPSFNYMSKILENQFVLKEGAVDERKYKK